MKDWNKTGKIKAIILGVFFLPNIIKPIGAQPNFEFAMVIMPLIFGLIAIPLIVKVNAAIFGLLIERPTWNDNPLRLKRPLIFFHFAAFLLLGTGLSMLIGTSIKFQHLNQLGLTPISFGIGILGGIQLLLKMTKK